MTLGIGGLELQAALGAALVERAAAVKEAVEKANEDFQKKFFKADFKVFFLKDFYHMELFTEE